MRRPGLRLGAIGGVPVYLTPGWALIAIVLVALFTPTVQRVLGLDTLPAAGVAAGVPLVLAISVLLHELAHGLTAQRLGITVREYVLSLWGGHTAFDAEIDRPGASALVAAAGPVTNGVLAVLLWWGSEVALSGASSLGAAAAWLVLVAAAYSNAFVAIFNALPALPMDGGRLLEALVWRTRGDRELGTLVAARVGQAVAVLVVLGALVYGISGSGQSWFTIIWGALIGWMLWQGATASVKVARARRAARAVDLAAWAVPAALLDQHEPVTAIRGVAPGTAVLLADGVGAPVAWVQPDAVRSVPPEAWASTPLSAVARALPPEALLTTHRGADAVAQLARAARAGARFVVLAGPDRTVLGVVDVVEAGRRLPR